MSATLTTDRVEQVVFDALVNLGQERADLRRDATFEELDVDSLDLVEIAQVVEERWGLELDPRDFGDIKTVGEAIDLVLAKMTRSDGS